MAPEKSSKAAVQPLTVSSFYEKEDRLAQNLANEDIERDLREIVDYIRTKIGQFGSDPEAWKGDGAGAKVRDSLLIKGIMLRRLNRFSNFRNRLLRERLATSRAKVDTHFLQLQNMRSEIDHLKRAIDACLEFQSMDSEIDLIPVEDFYERAPESISKPEITKEDTHQLHLARLTFELEERKNMLGNLQELEGRKSVLLSDIRGKELRLRQIKPKISALKQSARPLLEILGLKSVDASAFDAQKKFAHLPIQLELVSLNASVFNELFRERLEIGCEGDVEKAIRFVETEATRQRTLATQADQSDEEEDGEEDDDEEEDADEDDVEMEEDEDRIDLDDENGPSAATKSKKSRKRKSRGAFAKKEAKMAKTMANDIGDSLSSENGNGSSGGRGKKALEARFQQKRDVLLNTHPISLTITIPVTNVPGQQGLKVRLSFVYLSELNCVGLKCKLLGGEISNWQILDPENLLDELYDGDVGRKCTNPTANALLKTLDTSIEKCALLVGRPYNFVEKLCGFAGFVETTEHATTGPAPNLLSTSSAVASRSQEQRRPMAERQIFELFADVVERVRSRVVSRFKLAECVESLEKNKSAAISSPLRQRYFPSKVLSKLVAFQPISAEDALAFEGLSPAQKSLLNQLSVGEVGAFHYKAVVERATSNAKFQLDALVRVPVAFPRRTPLFLLVIKTDAFRQSLDYVAGIAELERFVNTTNECEAADETLAFQMAYLCSRLDVVVEVTAQRLAADSSTPEFSLEHSFTTMTRGATQTLPFAFDHRTNAFCVELPSSNGEETSTA